MVKQSLFTRALIPINVKSAADRSVIQHQLMACVCEYSHIIDFLGKKDQDYI